MLCLLHAIFHAFFKCMLFLCVGEVIVSHFGDQNSRFLNPSNGKGYLFIYIFLSCLCLSGFPFTVGFYRKDYIIYEIPGFFGFFYMVFFYLGCFLTVLYRCRVIKMVFLSYFYGIVSFFSNKSIFSFVSSLYLFFFSFMIGEFVSFFCLSHCMFFRFVDLFMGVLIVLFSFFFYLSFFYLTVFLSYYFK